jgi:hypothetical protein
VKLRVVLLVLLVAIPFLGICNQIDNSDLKSSKTYTNHDEKAVSHFSFVGQNIPENSKGQTFLSKHIPKAINTSGRIIVHDIAGTSQGYSLDGFTMAIPRPLTNSYCFIDRFLRSSIAPQAP